MTIDIDFYLISGQTQEAASVIACRLAEKAYKKHHQVYLYASSQIEAIKLSDMLWTFNDISFVPHGLYNELPAKPAPVIIGFDQQLPDTSDILINLTDQLPDFYQNFKRILEIIPNDKELKAHGRKKYKKYQEDNCKITSHDLS